MKSRPGARVLAFTEWEATMRSGVGLLDVEAVTVTAIVCVAVKLPESVAVTVIVALPAATGVRVTTEPDTPTVATEDALEVAV